MTYEPQLEHHRQFERTYRLGMYGGWTQGAIWTRRLLIILGTCWVAALVIPKVIPSLGFLIGNLYLQPSGVMSGKIWQFITAPLFGTISPCQWWVFLFHLFYLFVFGPKVEREWGPARFIRYYILIALSATIIAFLLRMFPPLNEFPASTTGAAVFAVMIAYGANWPRDPFYVFGMFPMPVIYIILFLCALEVLFMVITPVSGFGVDYVSSAAGVALGFAAMKIPFVKAFFVGIRQKKKVTTGGRTRRAEFEPIPTLRPGSNKPPVISEPEEPARKPSSKPPVKKGKKGKRSGFLEF